MDITIRGKAEELTEFIKSLKNMPTQRENLERATRKLQQEINYAEILSKAIGKPDGNEE